MDKPIKELLGLFCLDHNIKIYIPSTVNGNQTIDIDMQTVKVQEVLGLFSDWFGGSSSYDSIGAWKSANAGLITENIKIVESYATKEQINQNMVNVIAYCRQIKKDMQQESIALEYDNKMYLV